MKNSPSRAWKSLFARFQSNTDYGDNETMYCADELDMLRWTGNFGGISYTPQ